LKTGLEIGRQGELYLYERKLEAALESYTSALGILVPFVNNEPKGERRNLYAMIIYLGFFTILLQVIRHLINDQ